MTWPTVSLGDVCELKYGKSLPAPRRVPGDVLVFGSNGAVGWHDEKLTDGPTIVIGRKGSFGEINYSATGCWPIDTTYFVDGRSTEADLGWLSHLLPTLGLTELNRAAAVPGLNREDAYRQTLLLPPLDEQRRIAAILDQADALRAKRRQTLAHLDDLTKSIFDRDTGRAGRPLVSLRDAGVDFQSGKNVVGTDSDSHLTNRVIKVSAVSRGSFDPSESKPLPATYEPPSTHRIRLGDILFGRASGSLSLLGATVHVGDPGADLFLPDKVWRATVKPRSPIRREFLLGVLHSPRFKAFVRHNASGAAGVHNIGRTKVLAYELRLPSPEDQSVFASQLACVDGYRSRADRAVVQDHELFASLQSRAFSGHL